MVRPVADHELFFSTTDRRGVITTGNSVFIRISRFSPEELIGAPHNVVRHPEMPAGAFHLMWDRLLVGRPMAAYVTNLAKDGATYRVFATVTPLGEGFLSVRMSALTPLQRAAHDLYAQTLEFERSLAVRGETSRAALAMQGAQFIERRLLDLGFDGYDAFMLAALPAEISSRGSLLTSVFTRQRATGPLAEVLASAGAINDQLEHLVVRLEGYSNLIALLDRAAEAVLQQADGLQGSLRAAEAASAGLAGQSPALLNVARVTHQPMSEAVHALEHLSPELAGLRRQVADLGFRIGLARLHTEMMGSFVAETIDGRAPMSSLAEIPRLCDAVQDGVLAMAGAVEQVNDSLVTVAGRIHDTARLMADFRHFLGQWRILVMRHRQGGAISDQLVPIDAQLDSMADQLAYLDRLALHCEGSVFHLDRDAIEPHLHRARTVAVYSQL